jgi:Carboxypeptidase regulatory-like domain
MSRGILALAIVLAAAVPAAGQLQGGSVAGTAADQTGVMLPGVTVTIRGADVTHSGDTNGQGRFRFLNLAPGTYVLTASLSGFTTVVHERVVVEVGKHVEMSLQLKDRDRHGFRAIASCGSTSDGDVDEFHRRRAHQDPDVAGSICTDARSAGRHRRPRQHRRQRDRAAVELRVERDPSRRCRVDDGWREHHRYVGDGHIAAYFNYDNFEEVQVSTAGQSIKQPTGGVGVNLIVKRGTNRWQAAARGYFTNDALEASNLPVELLSAGVTANGDLIRFFTALGGTHDLAFGFGYRVVVAHRERHADSRVRRWTADRARRGVVDGAADGSRDPLFISFLL